MVEPMTHDTAKAGSESLGRYRLVATLGQGGMGTIHLAVAGGLGAFRKLIVVKELRRDLTQNQRFVEMFLAEAKLAARLNHPNVIQTLEAGREEDRHFLAMEFLDGQPFSEVLKRARPPQRFPLALRIHVLCEALAGLHYAHELCGYDGAPLDIVHRDVSPQNVFVTYDGQIKVLDFGIAKAAGEDSLTSPGVFKGKFAYASPEQVRGQPSDRRTDVFAVGVMLWETIAMRRFAPGAPTRAAIEARISGTEPRLSVAVPGAPPLLAEICERAIHVDPAKRFSTAEDMRAALLNFLRVSGEHVDSKVIAKGLRAMFGEERQSMHRLIDANIRNDDQVESMVRVLYSPTLISSGNDDPTTVADLSQLIESSREPSMAVATRTESPPELPPQRKPWFWGAIAVAAVGAGAFVLGTRHPAPPEVTATVSSLKPAETVKPPQPPADVAAVPAPPPEPVVPVARSHEPRAARQAAPVAAVTSGGVLPGSGLGDLTPLPDRRPSAERSVTDRTAAGQAARAVPAGPRDAHPGAEPKTATTAKEEMGDDLRQLRRQTTRSLDEDNPFK
jgi:serine/threonine protein kinase